MLRFLDFPMRDNDEILELDGMRVRSEEIGFAAEEMIPCGECSKNNPPNRLNCFYCGARLELADEIAAGLQFRPSEIEDWEPGVNIVITGGSIDAAAIAATLLIDAELLEDIIGASPPFPLIRVRPDEADEAASRLERAGMAVEKVADKTLDHLRPPTRLKGIDLRDCSADLNLFNSDRTITFEVDEVKLIVAGAIFKSSSEATIRRKRKETKHVDEKFSASDYAVIDLYAGDDVGGFRILPHGFDFSCLGEKKSLLAVENMRILRVRLQEVFKGSVLDDMYSEKLSILDHVWPRTVTNISKGMQRVGMKVERSIGESVSNEEQFTRYSRMRRELI